MLPSQICSGHPCLSRENQGNQHRQNKISPQRGNLYKTKISSSGAPTVTDKTVPRSEHITICCSLEKRAADHPFSKRKIVSFPKSELQLYFFYMTLFTKAQRGLVRETDFRPNLRPAIFKKPLVLDVSVENYSVQSLYIFWFLDPIKLVGRPRAH